MTSVFDPPRRPCEGETVSESPERWLGPNGYTLQSWEVDFRTGGAARLCVRSPEGTDQWVDGVYLEIVEPERVVFTGDLGFAGGAVTFRRA
jgi:uncharacterized protein YndB with AHSA1/START domain